MPLRRAIKTGLGLLLPLLSLGPSPAFGHTAVCDPPGPAPRFGCQWSTDLCDWFCPVCDFYGVSPRSTCTWGGKLCNWICPGCLTASSFGCPETPFALGLSNDPAVFDQAGLGPLPDGESDSTTGTLSSCAPMPGPVSNVSLLMLHGADLILLTWDDATNADDYVVFSDTAPNGVFSGAVGVATSGSSGLTVSVPQEDEFYLVGDRNVTCGIGPRH